MLLIYVLGGSCQRNIGLIFNLATIHEGVTPSNLPRYKMVNGSPNGTQLGKIDLCLNDKQITDCPSLNQGKRILAIIIMTF